MEKIKTLLVDDEFLALNLLENFAGEVADLEIVDKVKSPVKAVEILNSRPVDLLFLDIQMPALSGINLLKTLRQPPVVIFTTAYSNFAVDAFDLNAVDYLLKPFSLERFLQAVGKAREQLKLRKMPPVSPADTPEAGKDYFTAKVDGKLVKIVFDRILFIEGLKEYVRIVCADGRYVTLESLQRLEGILPAGNFLRVHKSYIVAKDKVQSLNGNMLEIEKFKIPISRSKKDEVVEWVFYR